MKDNPEELFPVTNERGDILGHASRSICHCGSMLLHPVVHLQVYNSKGELYLQRRPAWKDIQPNRWDTAVGGHVGYGETAPEALIREAEEELGIRGFEVKFRKSYVFTSDKERELVYCFTTVFDGVITPSEELDGGRFWSHAEIEEAIADGSILTPNFMQEYRMLQDLIKPQTKE